MAVDERSEISISIHRGTLPWQPIVVGFIYEIEFRRRSEDGVQLIRRTQAASGAAGRARRCCVIM